MAQLQIKNQNELWVYGALTFYTVDALCQNLLTLMFDASAIQLNLSQVRECDTASLVFVLVLLRQARARGQSVKIIQIPEAMKVLIRLYNLSNLIVE